MKDTVVAYVSDTPSTMKPCEGSNKCRNTLTRPLWCMDHCLNLFLKACKDIMLARLSKPKLWLLLLPLFVVSVIHQSASSECRLQVDEALKIAAETVKYFSRNGVPNSLLIA